MLCRADHGEVSVLSVPYSSVFPIPQRKHGYQGYHRMLKAVCLNKGAYTSRTFCRLDIKNSLAQPNYGKIDMSFGNIFR